MSGSLSRSEVARRGGITRAKKSREEALARYYSAPNVCPNCESVIAVRDGERVSDARHRKFCNHSCCASFNNKIRNLSGKGMFICADCGQEFRLNKRSDGGYKRRKFCSLCLKKMLRINGLKFWQRKRPNYLSIAERTKGELFRTAKSWQSARSTIRKHACEVVTESGREMKCAECGYSKIVVVCHIRPVFKFVNDSLISEINSLENLVVLCPNHHAEFDAGMLVLEAQDRQIW